MKFVFTSLTMLAFCTNTFAQNAFSNSTCSGLEKVIQDYPNRFRNIKGDMIVQNQQSTEYQSKIRIQGASSCIVIRYNLSKNDVYSWGCRLIKTTDFNAAQNKFKEIFDQIKNSIVKVHGEAPFILNGKYEAPDQEKKSTDVIFELLPAVGEMKKLIVDLSLRNENNEWQVSLDVYDRDRKETEQGFVTENHTSSK